MAKRIEEFRTGSRKEYSCLYLYAWASYKRGDVPDAGEFEYINNRVMSKYPNAEFTHMHRIPIPTGSCKIPFTHVRWEFEWAVYDYKKGSEVKSET